MDYGKEATVEYGEPHVSAYFNTYLKNVILILT